MQPSNRSAENGAVDGCSDRGSASLEFITAGLLMLVPLVYLILTLGTIQSAALATEGAARQGARVFVQAESTAAGTAAARRALDLALADHGLDPSDVALSISCTPNPGQCHTRRGWVTVDIAVRVPLPLVPPIFDLRVPLAVPVEASATQQVSRFWGAR
ncbi:hypothetical protein [Microcella sp.]|uniref:hypothetical protein n=1 Tax=Microcella sp. TaxID=1913979 RepID=UPI002569BCFF|nr:hypothetical protein [Microcella sp.]MBX9471261.1 pilus assembly protein [Microcella sp.]